MLYAKVLSCQARAIPVMPNPHGDPLLKQPLMKIQPPAYDILFGKPGYVYLAIMPHLREQLRQ